MYKSELCNGAIDGIHCDHYTGYAPVIEDCGRQVFSSTIQCCWCGDTYNFQATIDIPKQKKHGTYAPEPIDTTNIRYGQ
jgi:hypothetical protein